eukprot:CAMPEP_0202870950 /NCGR_PEP_ID=MMETSP1391-20130828/17300_1 /ASSEMBLY_ACC=CAM_ASM_000867 /TAXON_ID=1034604 /ORGANISM="Chlamydomonas leiostraca, Strain SAG 11-49" /LENGTH=130 /DNA_ID=CAMNT_0049551635 /DNA_START=42 /DNA_END=431 /DNA_ORIENTATION=+
MSRKQHVGLSLKRLLWGGLRVACLQSRAPSSAQGESGSPPDDPWHPINLPEGITYLSEASNASTIQAWLGHSAPGTGTAVALITTSTAGAVIAALQQAGVELWLASNITSGHQQGPGSAPPVKHVVPSLS